MKADFDVQMQLHVSVEQCVKREEKIKQEALVQVKQVTRDEESKNINFRKENASLKIKNISNEEQIFHLQLERDVIKERYDEISAHYMKLYDETKHLIYALERREHDLNFLKAKMSQKEADNNGTFNIILGKLRQENSDTEKEKDRLQQLWLESQKDYFKARDRSKDLEQENSSLKVFHFLKKIETSSSDK